MLPSDNESFLADLEATQQRAKKCGLGEALRSMEKDLKDEVVSSLNDPQYYATTITTALKKRGFRVNEWQVRNCRRQCDCGELPGGSE